MEQTIKVIYKWIINSNTSQDIIDAAVFNYLSNTDGAHEAFDILIKNLKIPDNKDEY